MFSRDGIIERIQVSSEKYRLDPYFVEAIILQESGMRPWACRYEPHYQWLLSPRDWASKLAQSNETEEIQQKTSWGLMQVMGAVARERGFDEYLPALCVPELGIEYGCKHLFWLRARWNCGEDLEKLASCYNQGNPSKTSGGLYTNQKHYVDPVMKRYRELAG